MKKTITPSSNVEDLSNTSLQERMGAKSTDRQAAKKDVRGGGFAESVMSARSQAQMYGNLIKTNKIRDALKAAGRPAYKGEASLNAQMDSMKDMLTKGGFK